MLPKNYFRRIAVDADDTVVDFMGCLVEWHNRTYGTRLTKYDFKDGVRISSAVGISREEGIARVLECVKLLNECNNNIIPVMPGARETLSYLQSQGFSFALVTARTSSGENATFHEMRSKFPGIFSDIYFSFNKSMDGTPRKSKAEICLDHNLEVIIEDDLKTALSCAQAGIYVLLFDQPWNQECPEHPNIKRARGWSEVAISI